MFPGEPARGPAEREHGLLAGHVERLHGLTGQAQRITVDREQRGPVIGRSGDEDQVRDHPVEHERLAAVQQVPVTGPARGDPELVRRPRTVVFRHSERGDRFAGGYPRQQIRLRGRVAAGQQRPGGEHGAGQIRRAQQRRAHLLAHDQLLQRPAARAAVLLRDGEPGQPEPPELRPDGRVVPGLGHHQPPNLADRRFLHQEPPYHVTQVLLLISKYKSCHNDRASSPGVRRSGWSRKASTCRLNRSG